MKKSPAVALVLSLLLLFPQHSAGASPRPSVDPTKATISGLSKCESPDQFDCVSAIYILVAGKRMPANQVSVSTESEVDELQQLVESGKSTWSYSNGGTAVSFTIEATLTTPEYVVSGSQSDVDVTKIDESTEVTEDSEDTSTTEKVNLDTRFFEPKLDLSVSGVPANSAAEIVVRTSWLSVEDSYLTAKDAQVKVAPIKGGNEITLSGSQVNLYQQQKLANQLTGKVKILITPIPTLNFTLFHTKKSSSTSCTDFGFRTISTNGSSVSLSDENEINSLLFSASGLAKKDDETPNLGFVTINIPLTWAQCFFPSSDFGFGESFNVRVTSNLGAPKVQNVAASAIVKSGNLEINVQGFEFAKTEILVQTDAKKAATRRVELAAAEAKAKAQAEADAKAKAQAEADAKAKAQDEADAKAKAQAEAETKVTAPKQKATTITCTKGKQVKKVKAVDPKCPAGFKKK